MSTLEDLQDDVKYEQLKIAVATRAEATARLDGFLRRVAELREEAQVPDVIIIASVFVKPDSLQSRPGEPVCVKSLGLGDSNVHASLGSTAYRHFTRPLVEHALELQNNAVGSDQR